MLKIFSFGQPPLHIVIKIVLGGAGVTQCTPCVGGGEVEIASIVCERKLFAYSPPFPKLKMVGTGAMQSHPYELGG